ncbi:hypothetical protein BJ138DRAFT_1020729 [Hygrophoropsis aurantiaca]|uniref:Uncharacterized protein n=1 Tax=Hygrophoropsis aurantiaca TaxID=72124 RepID=A0ACB7ZRR5_9AGAM|nr:hypothetical protein BJ138DRAFT_1020729 [Hygrophoropsis aurantiaca]
MERTNHQKKDFIYQVVRHLNREEIICHFDLYSLFRHKQLSLSRIIIAEFDAVVERDPMLAWISRALPGEETRFNGPRPVRNHFLKGLLSHNATTAFHVTVEPNHRRKSTDDITAMYKIPDFGVAFLQCLQRQGVNPQWGRAPLRVWYKFRLQLYSILHRGMVMPSQLVQAYPPSLEFPYGNCDTVLLSLIQPSGEYVDMVAQVRAVFQVFHRSDTAVPVSLSAPLVYVQLFDFVSPPDADVAMWVVERQFSQSGSQVGTIVALTDITHPIELIPVYGKTLNPEVNSKTSLEVYNQLFE